MDQTASDNYGGNRGCRPASGIRRTNEPRRRERAALTTLRIEDEVRTRPCELVVLADSLIARPPRLMNRTDRRRRVRTDLGLGSANRMIAIPGRPATRLGPLPLWASSERHQTLTTWTAPGIGAVEYLDER